MISSARPFAIFYLILLFTAFSSLAVQGENQPYKKHLERAYDLARQGRCDRAILEFSKAIELNPSNADSYHDRGVCHLQTEQTQQALADFESAINLNDQNGMYYHDRANAYLSLGQYDKAVADYDRASRLLPRYAAIYPYIFYGKGQALELAGKKKDAIEAYRATIKAAQEPFFEPEGGTGGAARLRLTEEVERRIKALGEK